MKALTYFELDVPYCTLTYGTLPCHARLPSAHDPVAALFNGTSAYATRGAGLTGAADSKLLTFSLWLLYGSDSVNGARVIGGASSLGGAIDRVRVRFLTGGFITVLGLSTAGTIVLDVTTSALLPNTLYHVMGSFDLSNTAKRHLYVDDVSDLTVSTYTNTNIDFTLADWGVGAGPDGSLKWSGVLADLWFAPGVYLDLSVESNRRKFIDSSRNPVDLGSSGNTPTGTAPLVFMSGDVSTWHTNKGTGGGLTLHGTIEETLFYTGTDRCYQTRATCQSIESIDEEDVTLRFGKPCGYLPADIPCIPCLIKEEFSPSTISPGIDLGQRASLSVTLEDSPHSDVGAGFDKYWNLRSYNPYETGTLFGKLRVRQPFLVGKNSRLIRGELGQAIGDMQRWHFFVETFDGPDQNALFNVTSKDVLKFLDSDRAQVPPLSSGFLVADISSSATSLTLSPSGIGNSEYRSSGYANLGGSEIVSYTRSGDAMTIVRGRLGSIASSHDAQDRVQEVLYYSSDDVANIVADVLSYTNLPSSYIDLAAWLTETATYLGTVYTGVIPEPTSVKEILNELIKIAALNVFDDNVNQRLILRVLRAIPTDAFVYDESNVIAGSFSLEDQPDHRRSQVWIFFGLIDPTKGLGDSNNYRSTSVVIDEDSERDYNSPVIEKIFSRWIPQFGRTTAERVGAILLARYRTPPRSFKFNLLRGSVDDPQLGIGYLMGWWNLQAASGIRDSVPIQLVKVSPGVSEFDVEAEEMRFESVPTVSNEKPITIDFNTNNLNMRSVFDTLYASVSSGDIVTCHVLSGVFIGSALTSLPAFDVGNWPAGVTLSIVNDGRIQGCGGKGRSGGDRPGDEDGGDGLPGGPALYSRENINLTNNGAIWGGGGGGGGGAANIGAGNVGYGGGGGGGGAGTVPGDGGSGGTGTYNGAPGSPGTQNAGGAGGAGATEAGAGGSGGGPGIAGNNGADASFGSFFHFFGGDGGSPGASIDGDSFVNILVAGDIRGPQIN